MRRLREKRFSTIEAVGLCSTAVLLIQVAAWAIPGQSVATCTPVIDGAVAGNLYTAGNAVLCLLGVSSAESAPRWSVTRWDDGDGTVEAGEGAWR